MRIPLTRRLLACCNFVKPGDRVADIGCDHGYLGIHLLNENIASFVIAADVKEGPLQNAVRNADKFGTKEKMSFYLSDGVKNIPRDFDCMVCAGMGANTMISILKAAPWLKDRRYRLILQCQRNRPELRKYLYENGFSIVRETLAQDGLFIYSALEAVYAPTAPLSPAQYYFTPALLASQSELLPEFMDRVIGGVAITVKGLEQGGGEKLEYYRHILEELKKIRSNYGNC